MTDRKTYSLRLDEDQARQLEMVARIDGVSVSEEIRDAIWARIDSRRSNPKFRAAVKAIIAEDRDLLDKLAGN